MRVMKNYIVALIITIFIHLLLFTSIELEVPKVNSPKKSNPPSSIKYVKLIQPQIKKIPQVQQQQIQKKAENKPVIKPKKKEYKKVSKKIKKVPKRTIQKKQNIVKKTQPKPEIKPQKPQQPVSALESLLSIEKPKPKDRVTQSYLDLYGKEYDTFTKEQKKYLENNLKNIGLITQRYLRYPTIAIRTHQQGTNVVEFFLHPNGDITDLKLISPKRYTSLDENSIHTIQIAYKDYPRPKEKTKIRIYVTYYLR